MFLHVSACDLVHYMCSETLQAPRRLTSGVGGRCERRSCDGLALRWVLLLHALCAKSLLMTRVPMALTARLCCEMHEASLPWLSIVCLHPLCAMLPAQ